MLISGIIIARFKICWLRLKSDVTGWHPAKRVKIGWRTGNDARITSATFVRFQVSTW